MTDRQWYDLLRVLEGELLDPLPVALIVDCPWLPGLVGASVLDYLTDDRLWLKANLKATSRFPEVMFMPGFWAEYGMCTEPSAFGARCTWPANDFPFAQKMLHETTAIERLIKPNCRTDGLCPFVIKRLQRAERTIDQAGHQIRFATSRGPLNIATYLLGHSETFLAMKTEPERIEKLLRVVTDFVVDWLRYQATTFPSIDGLLILDDLIGFVGEEDFRRFVIPYFRQIGEALDVSVKILHNDCHGLITAKHLVEMGFNVFNFGHQHSLGEIRQAAGETVVLMGNIPPRDVLAQATPEVVRQSVRDVLQSIERKHRLLVSAGGGTPPGVPEANIEALITAAKQP